MVAKSLLDQALALPPADRLELMDRLWESLRAQADGMPLTDGQREELDRRIRDMEDDPRAESDWDEAAARLRARQ